MKKQILFIFFLLPLTGAFLYGQEQDSMLQATYFFEGEEVVFQFDSRQYRQATIDGTDQTLDFADFQIDSVIVSGGFNDWSRQGWKMEKVGPTTFQLRKKITDFDDAYTWDFKYFINGKYWAEPNAGDPHTVKIHPDHFWQDVYNLSLYTARPSKDGNAHFFLPDHEDASEVIVTGSFIGWDENRFKMNKVDGGWELRLNLDPGRYEYKYIIDGSWFEIPQSEHKVKNIHGTFNSVKYVSEPVKIRLEGYEDADYVAVAGSFNNWNPDKDLMTPIGKEWVIMLELDGGKHLYKFIIDGKWLVDPDNPLTEKDKEGNVNSVLLVR